jgi:hypothetical protein
VILINVLAVAKLRERLVVSKTDAKNFDAERFNLRKLNELEVRKRYKIKISTRFAAFENLNDSKDINMALESIKQNIKTSAKESLYELKKQKPWVDECLRF